MRNRPKPLDHPEAEGGEERVSVMAFSRSCRECFNRRRGENRNLLWVTCLDGNLHRDDLTLSNVLGDHRTIL